MVSCFAQLNHFDDFISCSRKVSNIAWCFCYDLPVFVVFGRTSADHPHFVIGIHNKVSWTISNVEGVDYLVGRWIDHTHGGVIAPTTTVRYKNIAPIVHHFLWSATNGDGRFNAQVVQIENQDLSCQRPIAQVGFVSINSQKISWVITARNRTPRRKIFEIYHLYFLAPIQNGISSIIVNGHALEYISQGKIIGVFKQFVHRTAA